MLDGTFETYHKSTSWGGCIQIEPLNGTDHLADGATGSVVLRQSVHPTYPSSIEETTNERIGHSRVDEGSK